jgi:hypothetical protein
MEGKLCNCYDAYIHIDSMSTEIRNLCPKGVPWDLYVAAPKVQ